MASEPTLTWILIGLGLRDLSMDPPSIPIVKSVIRASRIADAETLVKDALALDNEAEIGQLVRRTLMERLPSEIYQSVAAWW
jgi:phosphotransferase system enzyme I (PtsI)